MANIVVKRGEVFYADMSPVIGSEQGGIRPVVILQNDIGNRYAPTVVVAAITSQINKVKLPIHVEISKEEITINRDSVVLLEQIRTLDKRRLKEKIGQLSIDTMHKINKALLIECGVRNYVKDDSKKEEIVEIYYRYKLGQSVDFLEEDIEHEFKEVKGNNPVNAIKSNVGEYITSFLNEHGGIIYYGISDDKIVKGINLSNKQKDEVRRIVYDAIASISPNLSPDNINLDFKEVYNSENQRLSDYYVLEVQVNNKLDERQIYVYKNEIHLRTNGIKKKLQGYELVDYIRRRTIKDFSLEDN
jgi:mRNA interferase MazF